jgi:RNA polymerase sigma factor (sigma-70 family)
MDQLAADRQILKGCISGEKKAREEFVIRFSNPVYQCIQFTLKAKNISFSQQDLEDLHNTVFLNFFDKRCKKLRQYRGKNGCSVFSWIRLITVRTAIDYIRKAGRDVIVRASEEFNFDNLPDLVHDGFEPLARMEKAEQKEQLMEGLEALMPRDRLFLQLHCLHGVSIQKVADMLQISENNAYSLKHRAIDRLKSKIAGNLKKVQ